MYRRISIRQSLVAAAFCSVLAASTALAQDRVLVAWTGKVDKEVQVNIRDTSISTSIVGGRPVKLAYFNISDRLPRSAGTVRVELNAERGDVDVVQQPSASNVHAAVLRIRDKRKDVYQITAFWNPQRGEDYQCTAAASAHAAEGTKAINTMHWIGSVDGQMKTVWRGSDEMTRTQIGGTARGNVSITQQPSSSTPYTASFSVRDPQTGVGHYDFDVNWR